MMFPQSNGIDLQTEESIDRVKYYFFSFLNNEVPSVTSMNPVDE